MDLQCALQKLKKKNKCNGEDIVNIFSSLKQRKKRGLETSFLLRKKSAERPLENHR
jgi:hypothetical protein